MPADVKRRIYQLLKKEGEQAMLEVGEFLLDILLENLDKMAAFAGPFDKWIVFPEDAPQKAAIFWKYFKFNVVDVDGEIRVTPAT